MAIVHFAADLKNEVLTPIKDAIDAGGAAGTISIYSGTMPATVETALTTQVLLGTLTFAFSCGSIAGGALTMDAITQDSAADAAALLQAVPSLAGWLGQQAAAGGRLVVTDTVKYSGKSGRWRRVAGGIPCWPASR